MKFLPYISHQNQPGNTRRIFVTKPESDAQRGPLNIRSERFGKAEAALSKLDRSPLLLTTSDILEISRGLNAGKDTIRRGMTASRRASFHRLINYQIDRLRSNSDKTLPSSLLFAVLRAPRLAAFLTPVQRRSIDTLLSGERRYIEQVINKGTAEWSAADSLRVMRSFRFVWGNKVAGKVDPVYRKASEKILEKTRDLIDQYEANGNQILADSPAKKGQKNISAKERLFILEAYRNFPTKNYWKKNGATHTYTLLRQAREDVRRKLFRENGTPDSPEFILFWELIDEEFAAGEGSYTPETISQFVERTQKVRFLQQLSKRPMASFGAEELNLIKQIQRELRPPTPTNPNPDYNDWSVDFENFIKGSEYADLTADMSSEEIKNNFEVSELTAEREKIKKSLEALKKKFLQQGAVPEGEDFDRFVTFIEDATNQVPDTYRTEWDDGAGSGIKQNLTSVDQEVKRKAAQSLSSLVKRLWEVQVVREGYENHSELEAERKKTERKLKAANVAARLQGTDKEELESIFRYFTQATSRVNELNTAHRENLQKRITERRLTPIDLELLREVSQGNFAPADYNIYLNPDLISRFGNLCDDFNNAVRGIIPRNLEAKNERLEEIRQDITKLRRPQLVRRIHEMSAELNVLPSMLIDLLAQGYREQVIGNLGHTSRSLKPFGTKRKLNQYREFFENYARHHQNIYDHNQLETLSANDADYRSQRKNLDRKGETVMTHLDQVFADSDPAQIREQILAEKVLPGKDPAVLYKHLDKFFNDRALLEQLRNGDVQKALGKLHNHLKVYVSESDLTDDYKMTVVAAFMGKAGRDEIIDAFRRRFAYWKQGNKTDSLSKEDQLELGRLFGGHAYQVNVIDKAIKDGLTEIQTELKRGRDGEYAKRKLRQLFTGELHTRWGTLITDFYGDLRVYLTQKYGAGAYASFINQQETSSEQLLTTIAEQVVAVTDSNAALHQDNSGFKTLAEALGLLTAKFDFLKGEWAAEDADDFENHIESLPETVDFIQGDLNLNEINGKNKAETAFNARNQKLQRKLNNYRKVAQKFLGFADVDLQKLSDEDFQDRYGMSREVLSRFAEQTRDGLTSFTLFTDRFGGADFFENWYAAYQDPAQRNNALRYMQGFRKMEDLVEECDLDQHAENLQTGVRYYEDNDVHKLSAWLGKYKVQIRWYSLKSIFEVGKRFFEARNRRIQRRDERMTAELGRRIFGDTDVGQEFQKMENEKFEERVNEYKKRHERQTYTYMVGVMNSTKDPDELFAIVELMLEKGWMRFDDADFLRALMKFQRKVKGFPVVNFEIPGDVALYTTRPEMVKLKIERAFMAIWNDYPAWLRWKGDMTSKYQSQVDSVKTDYEAEVGGGGVDRYLREILEKWRRGDPIENFEPYRVEGYLHQAFDKGQMNGPSHRRLYYLIMAMGLKHPKTGKTLLSSEAYRRIAQPLFNKVPFLDALLNNNSPKKDGQIVPPGTPGSREGDAWGLHDFQCWIRDYFTGFDSTNQSMVDLKSHQFTNEVLMNTWSYKNRMNKADLEKIDRDEFGSLWPGSNYDRMVEIWTKASGDRSKQDIEARYNFLTEFKSYFKANIDSYRKDISRNDLDRDSEAFAEWRRERLLKIGNMVRVSFMSFNKMAGNYNYGSPQPPSELDREYWEDDNSDVNKNRWEINRIMGELGFNLSDRLKTMNAVKEYGTYDDKRDVGEERQIHEVLGSDIFFDIDRIEDFVMNYESPSDTYQHFGSSTDDSKSKED